MDANMIKENLREFLGKKKYYNGDVYLDKDDFNRPRICVEIIWGDWKHDHLYLDILLNEWLDENDIYATIYKDVTEEDGSDSYSAIHYIVLGENG